MQNLQNLRAAIINVPSNCVISVSFSTSESQAPPISAWADGNGFAGLMGFVATFAKGAEGAISGRGGAWKGCTGCIGRAAWKPPGRKGWDWDWLSSCLGNLIWKNWSAFFFVGGPAKKKQRIKIKDPQIRRQLSLLTGNLVLCPRPNAFWILLMEEILHQLIGFLSHYSQGFIHPEWCRIFRINSIV